MAMVMVMVKALLPLHPSNLRRDAYVFLATEILCRIVPLPRYPAVIHIRKGDVPTSKGRRHSSVVASRSCRLYDSRVSEAINTNNMSLIRKIAEIALSFLRVC